MNEARRAKLKRFLFRAVPFVLVAAVLAFWPLPYYVYGPWSADDLNRVVHVKGYGQPKGTLYETSIMVLPGRPASYLAGRWLPGFEVVPRTNLAPPSMSDLDVLRFMYMSQEAAKKSAEIVAARAAGLPVELKRHFFIRQLNRHGPAAQCFRTGDRLLRVGTAPIDTLTRLLQTAANSPPGSTFIVTVERDGAQKKLHCTTALMGGKPRFGVYLGEYDELGKLPLEVTYTLPFYQSGGSTGLMYALQIYRTVSGADLTSGGTVAGTGVIDENGNVQPIVGARQKIIAARRAGATLFLVPKQNALDVRNTPGMTVIPVGSFNEAVNRLTWRKNPCISRAADDIESMTGVKFEDLSIGNPSTTGIRLPAGIFRLDYGHEACDIIRFWYFWNDRSQPLRVRFVRAAIRSASLTQSHGGALLTIVDGSGISYKRRLAVMPDALVGYYINRRPSLAIWSSPNILTFIGFDKNGPFFWNAQPGRV